MIVLFQICGNKTIEKKGENMFIEDLKKSRDVTTRIAKYIIDPKNKYKVMWDLSIGIIYLMSYLADPVVFAF